MKIIIRADASIKMGSGHVMRCLTLAEALKKYDTRVEFICREHEGNLISLINGKGFIVHKVPVTYQEKSDSDHSSWLGATWQEDAKAVQKVLKKVAADWLVIDHYALDVQWERQLRPLVKKIMVIDDLADRRHDCDLLLDQNFYLNKEDRYKGLVSEGCVRLLGPDYALLREEFSRARKNLKSHSGQIKRILIFFGGSDPSNETGKTLDAIKQLGNKELHTDIIIGQSNPYRSALKTQIKSMPNTRIYHQVDNMADFMVKSDLMIGAGGSTTWERCCLGRPSLVITIAKNQEQTAEDSAGQGYIFYLGPSSAVTSSMIYDHLKCLIENHKLTAFISEHSKKLVDAHGVKKVVTRLTPSDILIRLAEDKDCENIFHWRNAEETRRSIFRPEMISWKDHLNWFRSTLTNPHRQLLIGEIDQNPVGVLRYDFDNEEAVISIYLVPGLSNKGLGTALIGCGNQWIQTHFLNIRRVMAEVLPSNKGSLKAFKNVGFRIKNYTLQYEFLE